MDWGGGVGSGPHTSDSHTNKTQVRLFTGEINWTTSTWPCWGPQARTGHRDVVQFINPVNNQPSVLFVFYYFLNNKEK